LAFGDGTRVEFKVSFVMGRQFHLKINDLARPIASLSIGRQGFSPSILGVVIVPRAADDTAARLGAANVGRLGFRLGCWICRGLRPPDSIFVGDEVAGTGGLEVAVTLDGGWKGEEGEEGG